MHTKRFFVPRLRWLAAIALIVLAVAFSRSDRAGGSSQEGDAPAATATRAAELQELALLRTQVADLSTRCAEPATAAPTVAPTLVPPVAAGQALAYPDGWTITVIGATARQEIGDQTTPGMFIQVDVILQNQAATQRYFPFQEWQLVDSAGRTYLFAFTPSLQLNAGFGPPIEPSLAKQVGIAFEVLPDAGSNFILQSTRDPAFRVQFDLSVRG